MKDEIEEVRIPGPKPWFIETVNASGAINQNWHELRMEWYKDLQDKFRPNSVFQRITAKYGAIVVYEERKGKVVKDNRHLDTWDI